MDREKVIKGQECCQISMSEENPFEKCEECPYNYIDISVQDCRSVLSGNTLELLKKQEAEIRQLRLALDIAKGTCNGIVVEGR
jgi:hypothetical protein